MPFFVGEIAAEAECEATLGMRYPLGWQKFLNDPGIVCELVRRAMATRGKLH